MQHEVQNLERDCSVYLTKQKKHSPILTLILEKYVMKNYFMKALFADNEFCKEGKHYSLGCDESGKEL